MMKKTINRSIALAVAALWSLPAAAGDRPPPTVYVAPGGVYIGSAQVHVGTGHGEHGYNGHSYNGGQGYVVPGAAYAPGYGPPPAYAPGYGPPVYAPGYAAPAPAYTPTYVPAPGYRAPRHAGYGARPTVYGSPYAPEYAPRPPAVVPYDSGSRCVISHGRMYCD